jgi:hypothetical protein
VQVFERDGTPVASWGEGVFVRPHGIFIGPDDTVYCTDDFGHAVHAFTPAGKLRFTLGDGKPSDTGATSIDYRTIKHAGPPFNFPTNLAIGPTGDLYVADGYVDFHQEGSQFFRLNAPASRLHCGAGGARGGGRECNKRCLLVETPLATAAKAESKRSLNPGTCSDS